MGTYFHGNSSEIGGGGGGDGLQTLILMNPAYVGYGDNTNHNHQQPPPQSSNLVFLNSSSAVNNPHSLAHAPPSQTQHFVGIPIQGTTTTTAETTNSPHDHQDVSALHGFLQPRVPYNYYNIPPDLGTAARDVTRSQQGLSLSLSSQQPPGYGSFRAERPDFVPAVSPVGGDEVRFSGGSPSPASGVTNGVSGVQSMLFGSRYLKAAQELLEEVVNVGKSGAESSKLGQAKSTGDTSAAAASGVGQSGGENSGKRGATELTTAERQEIQMKKAKLVNMLDEVEQRYRQYHHQMQIVISWFEQAAGVGSAKTYTALALQTISKQFRCLKDAIMTQMRSASKSLGEEECLEGKIEGSRLKYVDNQIRQQRALQQLGMIQHNAWRPQRGLPERSVSVLRAWLFEHFLHPYPKDSDKIMLAKQTGLKRSQVSNWFINARVRLWKPMVEEMYTEEMKEHEKNVSEDDNNNKRTSKTDQNEDSTSKSTPHFPQQAKSPNQDNNPVIPGFNISSEIESISQHNNSPKKFRIIGDMLHSPSSMSNMDSANNDRQGRDVGGGFTLMGAPTNFIGGFGSYPMGELGRFGGPAEPFPQGAYSGNGVSLTLGPPLCENIGAHQSFLQPNHGIVETNDFGQTNAHSNNVYESISIQDRKRFAAQLLPDFVA
ncbi:hypothetical protein CASFOL_027188 [Castilleja foliolosa]|uniref:Homeobox domain-containing protein n=1 Tax=Castilleja foliolosa TaxID=1961234 RepID=A0ABD3CHI2_9LAMI